MRQIALKSQPFTKKIILNRIKDLLHFNSQILSHLFSKTRDFHIPYSTTEKKVERLLINYLKGLDSMLMDPIHQVCAHGIDLIEVFVGLELGRLWQGIEDEKNRTGEDGTVFVNVDKESWKIITKIF